MIEDSLETCDCLIQESDGEAALPLRYLGTNVVLKNYSIDEMAEQCHLTAVTFKRRFTKEYGLPPRQWLTRQRLEHASRLLLHSSLSIKEICYRCDFSSPSNFSRSFRREFHCTPEEFRARGCGDMPISSLEYVVVDARDGAKTHIPNYDNHPSFECIELTTRPIVGAKLCAK